MIIALRSQDQGMQERVFLAIGNYVIFRLFILSLFFCFTLLPEYSICPWEELFLRVSMNLKQLSVSTKTPDGVQFLRCFRNFFWLCAAMISLSLKVEHLAEFLSAFCSICHRTLNYSLYLSRDLYPLILEKWKRRLLENFQVVSPFSWYLWHSREFELDNSVTGFFDGQGEWTYQVSTLPPKSHMRDLWFGNLIFHLPPLLVWSFPGSFIVKTRRCMSVQKRFGPSPDIVFLSANLLSWSFFWKSCETFDRLEMNGDSNRFLMGCSAFFQRSLI